MNILLDSSFYLRILFYYQYKTPLETEDEFLFTVFNLFLRNPEQFSLFLPPIVFAETASRGFMECQSITVVEFLRILENISNTFLEINESLLQSIKEVTQVSPTKKGADSLIVAWALKEDCIFITGDKQQYIKAQKVNLECYNFRESYDRLRLASLIKRARNNS